VRTLNAVSTKVSVLLTKRSKKEEKYSSIVSKAFQDQLLLCSVT
jgi:hypothetical protein